MKRRVERVIDFTEESLSKIPVAKSYMDVWYDKQQPYLSARRIREGEPVDFLTILNAPQQKAQKIMGQPPTRYVRYGHLPLDKARTLASETWSGLQGLVQKAFVKVGPIPPSKLDVVPEDILADKDKVENPNYDALMGVLMDAFTQASEGKGADRHGFGLNFEDQDMIAVTDRVGLGFPLGQAIKKLSEGKRLNVDLARKEFLGAIVYIAGAIVWMDKQ